MNEDCGNAQFRKVIGSKLRGFPGRMQRIGQKQQSIACMGILRRDHAGLPPSIGLSSQIQRDACGTPAQFLSGLANAFAVALARSAGCPAGA